MKLNLQKLFILCLCVTRGYTSYFTTPSYTEEQKSKILEKYAGMEKTLKNFAYKGVKALLPYIIEARGSTNLSRSCTLNLLQLGAGIRRLDAWALRFIDAMGKIPSGVLSSNINMYGDYDECLATTVVKNRKVAFRGQYCLVHYRLSLPPLKHAPDLTKRAEPLMSISNKASGFLKTIAPQAGLFYYLGNANIGICVPSGCNKDEVSYMVKNVLDQMYLEGGVAFCRIEGEETFWTTSKICMTFFLCFLVALIFIGTGIDYILKEKNDKYLVTRILVCFSLIKNFPKVISTKTAQKNLTCFNGMRSLSTIWVVLGHEYLVVAAVGAASHPMNFEKLVPAFFAQIILNGSLSVDTFFFLSGFLNSYIRMERKEKGKPQPSILTMIVHRLWRLYPGLLMTHLIFALSRVTNPISYTRHLIFHENCRKYWWRNFLFISNLFKQEEACMQQIWYVSADMQLFLISLFTVPLLIRSPKKGVILHFVLIGLAIMSTTILWWVEELPPAFAANRLVERDMNFMLRIFSSPLVHFSPYFIGILMGYFIATKREVKISKTVQAIGWMTSSLLCTFFLFITRRWNSGSSYTQLESSLHGGFSKSMFTLGVAWVVFSCVTGRGGVANYILSLSIWFPLSKLSYMVYLISPLLQSDFHGNTIVPIDFNHKAVIFSFFGNLLISFLLSLALVLLIESPFIALEKIIFYNREVQEKTKSHSTSEIAQNVEMKINNPS